MALIKASKGYGTGAFRIETGDQEIDSTMDRQLEISADELMGAINAENVTDKLFGRILKNRSKAHQILCDKIPGAANG